MVGLSIIESVSLYILNTKQFITINYTNILLIIISIKLSMQRRTHFNLDEYFFLVNIVFVNNSNLKLNKYLFKKTI